MDVRATLVGPPEDSEVAARTAMHHPIFSYRRFFLVHCPLSLGFSFFSSLSLSLSLSFSLEIWNREFFLVEFLESFENGYSRSLPPSDLILEI